MVLSLVPNFKNCACTVFLILCLGLVIYICKDKTKRKNSPSPSLESEEHRQTVERNTDPSNIWRSPPVGGIPQTYRSETDLYMASGNVH